MPKCKVNFDRIIIEKGEESGEPGYAEWEVTYRAGSKSTTEKYGEVPKEGSIYDISFSPVVDVNGRSLNISVTGIESDPIFNDSLPTIREEILLNGGTKNHTLSAGNDKFKYKVEVSVECDQ